MKWYCMTWVIWKWVVAFCGFMFLICNNLSRLPHFCCAGLMLIHHVEMPSGNPRLKASTPSDTKSWGSTWGAMQSQITILFRQNTKAKHVSSVDWCHYMQLLCCATEATVLLQQATFLFCYKNCNVQKFCYVPSCLFGKYSVLKQQKTKTKTLWTTMIFHHHIKMYVLILCQPLFVQHHVVDIKSLNWHSKKICILPWCCHDRTDLHTYTVTLFTYLCLLSACVEVRITNDGLV